MNIIIMGLSASGKGTQAKLLSEKLGLPHISTGEIFRQEFAKDTPGAKEAKSYYYAGKWVPSQMVFKLLKPYLDKSKHGFILDGFPRLADQPFMLDEYLRSKGQKIDRMFLLIISDKEAVKRHLRRAKEEGRQEGADQMEEERLIRERLASYHQAMAPIINYYQDQGALKMIDGERAIEEIHKEILKHLP